MSVKNLQVRKKATMSGNKPMAKYVKKQVYVRKVVVKRGFYEVSVCERTES